MDVIYLLPDHPIAPKGQTLEALLPDLILTIRFSKEIVGANSNQTFCRETLQLSDPRLNVSVARIYYQVEVIEHNYEAYEFRSTPFDQGLELLEEYDAVSFVKEKPTPFVDVARDVVQGTWKVLIRPFLCHVGAGASPPSRLANGVYLTLARRIVVVTAGGGKPAFLTCECC